MINVDEDVEKKETLYTSGINVNSYSYYGKLYGGSLKIRSRTTA